MQETWLWSLGLEDSLEKGMVTHSRIFAWRTPWTEEPGRLQSMGSQIVGHDWATFTSTGKKKSFILVWEALASNWQFKVFCPYWFYSLISCFCLSPGKSHGQRSLMGHRPWGWQESDVTSGLHHHQLTDSSLCRGRGAEEALFTMSTNSLTFQVHYAPNCRDSETRSVHFPDSRLV